jgi:translocation and assembly module TamB
VPRAFGELRIEDGRYRAYGQRLQIRRGQFLFAGPIDQPSLSIEAIRDVPAHNVVAGLRVEGHPDALQSSLFSEPAMPEEDVLAFLLLGRPLSGGEETDSNAPARPRRHRPRHRRRRRHRHLLAETLGIEQFQLDTAGEGDDTQVVVSGYVSSRLQLSYGVGVFVPANTLTLRYRLARSLFLEAASGIESALDLLYTFRF